MRILFHCWEFPPNGTGVGTYIEAMSRALVAQGHRVNIATGRAEGRAEIETGPCGTIYRLYDRRDLRTDRVACRVLEMAREEKVDWIECADHLGEGVRLIAAQNRPPIVVKIHNSNAIRVVWQAEIWRPWQRATIGLALIRSWNQLRAEKKSLRGADCLLVPSERLRQELIKQNLLKPDQGEVVPNPAVPAQIGRMEAMCPTILFAGRVCIGKGIGFLPQILRALVTRFPDLMLEIAGPDSYARGLGSMQRWLAGQLGHLIKHVRFLGVLGPAEMDAAYRRAWVMIIPSVWDNFPGSLLEALARETPVISSPHGGMTEMLAGTNCPVADPSSSAFVQQTANLLADGDLRRRIGQSGRNRVLAEYDPARIANKYVEAVKRGLAL